MREQGGVVEWAGAVLLLGAGRTEEGRKAEGRGLLLGPFVKANC